MVIDYFAIVEQRLSRERFLHTLQVAESAKLLAFKYGADEDKAYLAGLLHDIMKDASKEEQLYIIKKTGIILTCYEKANPKLWHSIAGAAYLREELGIKDEDVFNAVCYHTTGRANMSLLEKVIYIADYISADRTYNGVQEMRRLAGDSLEVAMLYALEFSIKELVETQQVIHLNSVDCYNELLVKIKQQKQPKS
ncbi:MAG: bis(5'-nucleosyl)-tetraphosphatase (symmetrical) YqeK [Eubacteriales bacterium]